MKKTLGFVFVFFVILVFVGGCTGQQPLSNTQTKATQQETAPQEQNTSVDKGATDLGADIDSIDDSDLGDIDPVENDFDI